jgi:MFS family permease
MWTGRLVYGISEGAIFIALVAGVARWFSRREIALATAMFLSLARVGSYSADKSTSWAQSLYDAGWQPPLWLGAALTGVGLVAALLFRLLDSRFAPPAPARRVDGERIDWAGIWSFDLSYWYILGLHVLYAAVFFPFRQTYAIEYFQHVKGLTLQQAGDVNADVFAAAVFATPLFGLIADRVGHRALILTVGTLLLPITFVILSLTNLSPWVSTVLMGELLAGAGDHLAGDHPDRRAAAPRYRTRCDHAPAERRPVGLEPLRRLARRQGRRGPDESGWLHQHDLVLRPAQPCRSHFGGAAVAAREQSEGPWTGTRARCTGP